MMKASIYTQYGSPAVLTIAEISRPLAKDNELLVKVTAATVNRTDCAILKAKPFIMRFFTGLLKPRKAVLGSEFSGEIIATGSKVTKFKPGEKIFGFNDLGLSAHAQYLAISELEAIASVSQHCSMQQAAACMEGAHYAYNFINKVALKSGDTVLINGASGGIGSALLQFCVAVGAQVSVVTESRHTELMISLGAHRVISYAETDFTKEEIKYDYIFDAVGKSSFFQSKHLLKNGGAYLSSELGFLSQNLFLPVVTKFWGTKKVLFPFPGKITESLIFIKKMLEDGKYSPVIDRCFTLEQISEAFIYVDQGIKTGNVVIMLASENQRT